MGQFFKQIFASLIGTIAALLLFITLGASGLVFLLIALAHQDNSQVVKDKSVLVFDLATSINDTKPPSTLNQVLSGEETKIVTLRQVLDALDKATKDRRIVALFLDGREAGSQSGYATLKEVRTALERFRAAGKKIIAYDVELREKDYYLASVADTVILNPMGMMEMNGLASQQLFLKGALDKYGIGVQVVRVGSYKGAVEPLTRKDLSPENREQIQALLTDVWADFLATVGKSRKLSPQQLQAIADSQGILDAKAAMASGLVDRVAYLDQVVVDLQKLTGNSEPQEESQSFRQIALSNYVDVPLRNAQDNSSNNKIAVIYAEGSIVNGQGNLGQVGGDRLAKELRKLRQDNKVKAVVLRINSPGGSATASDIILRELQLINAQKPVVVSMGNVAASGGYWIATGGDRIFAETTTITGSIGVFGLLPNIQKISTNNGLTWDEVKTGSLADIESIVRPKTEQELAIIQKYVNQTYDLFLDKVAQSRNLSKQRVNQIAQGRVWSGEEAKKIGLVDQIGGLEVAIKYAAQKAKLGNNWEIQEYPAQRSLAAEIFGKLLDSDIRQSRQPLAPITSEFLKIKDELVIFQSLNDPQDIYALFPLNWQMH